MLKRFFEVCLFIFIVPLSQALFFLNKTDSVLVIKTEAQTKMLNPYEGIDLKNVNSFSVINLFGKQVAGFDNAMEYDSIVFYEKGGDIKVAGRRKDSINEKDEL